MEVIVNKVWITENWFERAKGLLGHDRLQKGEGMLIDPCNSIHTFFMSFAIDVVYLDKKLNVVKVCASLSPWRLSSCFKASMVLELPAQTISKFTIQKGMSLSWQEEI